MNETNRSATLVLDPFLGSGTTLAACLELGVNGIGFEIFEEYINDVQRRFFWVGRVGNGELRRAHIRNSIPHIGHPLLRSVI